MKTAYMIHGGGEDPSSCWFPWLKKQLEQNKYTVFIPQMPNRTEDISGWVDVLVRTITNQGQTIIIGHSRGCQAILRYLQNSSLKFAGIYLVAPFTKLKHDDWRSQSIAHWLKKPIDWMAIKKTAPIFVAIFSDNDDIVDVSESDIFKKNLGAKIIIEHKQGHFDDAAKITELPRLWSELNKTPTFSYNLKSCVFRLVVKSE